ncbi:hypothetical protein MY10362_005979 [Beauveria mimosiformis]
MALTDTAALVAGKAFIIAATPCEHLPPGEADDGTLWRRAGRPPKRSVVHPRHRPEDWREISRHARADEYRRGGRVYARAALDHHGRQAGCAAVQEREEAGEGL